MAMKVKNYYYYYYCKSKKLRRKNFYQNKYTSERKKENENKYQPGYIYMMSSFLQMWNLSVHNAKSLLLGKAKNDLLY